MEVLLESEEQMGRNKEKGRGKRQRPNGPPAPTPPAVADQTGRVLTGARWIGWRVWWMMQRASQPWSGKCTTKPGGRQTYTSPGCWPRQVNTPRWPNTSTK